MGDSVSLSSNPEFDSILSFDSFRESPLFQERETGLSLPSCFLLACPAFQHALSASPAMFLLHAHGPHLCRLCLAWRFCWHYNMRMHPGSIPAPRLCKMQGLIVKRRSCPANRGASSRGRAVFTRCATWIPAWRIAPGLKISLCRGFSTGV